MKLLIGCADVLTSFLLACLCAFLRAQARVIYFYDEHNLVWFLLLEVKYK
jgi:hypothetical protein